MINKTTKRLLSASKLGVCFDYGDGHRWIRFYDQEVTDNETLFQIMERNNIDVNTKVYGNIIDCLNFVDIILEKIGLSSLEKRFDYFNDWGLDDEFISGDIDWEESGIEEKEYFINERIKTK